MSLLHSRCLSCTWRLRIPDIPRISRRNLRIARHRISPIDSPPKSKPWVLYPVSVLLLGGASWVAYENVQPFRHTLLASVRCSRVAGEFQKHPASNATDRS